MGSGPALSAAGEIFWPLLLLFLLPSSAAPAPGYIEQVGRAYAATMGGVSPCSRTTPSPDPDPPPATSLPSFNRLFDPVSRLILGPILHHQLLLVWPECDSQTPSY